jgi:uncharacterized protein
MDQKLKNYVGIAAILALVLVGYSATRFAESYSHGANNNASGGFTVSGEGKVVTVPDVAQFSFSVITQGGKDLAKLQQDNTTKVNKTLSYIKAQGVKKEDIKTSGYHIEPRYQYYPCDGRGICRPAEIVGYNVNQSVTVKVRDFEKAGALLAGSVQNGANSVSQLQFTMDNPEAARSLAKAEAIKNARNQAEIIAKAGGFKIGRLLSVDYGENGSQPMPYMAREKMMNEVALDAGGPMIEPGSQEVIMTAHVRFEIK